MKYKDIMDTDLKKCVISYIIENQWKHPHLGGLNLQNSHPYLHPYKNIHPLYLRNIPKNK